MKWTGQAWRIGCALTLVVLAGCATGTPPNDVAEGVGFQDYQEYQARRAALRTPPPSAPQTALPPASVVAEPFGTPTTPTAPTIYANPAPATAPTATNGSVDVARIAAGAIAEAEGGPAVAPSPTQTTAVTTADDFVAPPLPEGTRVLPANVVAFALSTQHSVGDRVYSRFPLRLARREVRCGDFRTTDLAQDWFLSNEGPERDRSGLDPDGDGFACNWSPERYRAEARAARLPEAPQTFETLQDG